MFLRTLIKDTGTRVGDYMVAHVCSRSPDDAEIYIDVTTIPEEVLDASKLNGGFMIAKCNTCSELVEDLEFRDWESVPVVPADFLGG